MPKVINANFEKIDRLRRRRFFSVFPRHLPVIIYTYIMYNIIVTKGAGLDYFPEARR